MYCSTFIGWLQCDVFASSSDPLCDQVKQIMSEMLDISILKTFSFLYFCASCMLLYSAYDVPYVYAPDTVSEMFSTKLASYVLSVIGIASTIGQILIGEYMCRINHGVSS